MTTKCGKKKKTGKRTGDTAGRVSLMLLPHFDAFCDLLLYRLSIFLSNKKAKFVYGAVIYASVVQ